MASPPKELFNTRMGLLCNPASVDSRINHAKACLHQRFPGALTALFSPQHGFFAEKQDNMIESDHMVDPVSGLPVFSLYGETRMPTPAMFDKIDTLVIDIQDVGTRVYTFIYTMAHCMEAARRFNKKIIVCDRPNPINGTTTEGNCLAPEYASFVGRYPIPMRHGLTIGELALFFNSRFGIDCDLEVIPMTGWKRGMRFDETGLPWVPPSPNMPTPATAAVYPGQVLLEGTNLSEGRGTTQPFELFGAPFIRHQALRPYLLKNRFPGVFLRETLFEPTSNKWRGEPCFGYQIHVTDFSTYRPYATTLKLLGAIIATHPEFAWTPPPYEYEYELTPIDMLIGDGRIRRRLEDGSDMDDVERSWQDELDAFIEDCRGVWLY